MLLHVTLFSISRGKDPRDNMIIYIYIYTQTYIYIYVCGQFRKYGLTGLLSKSDPDKQGKGVQQGSGGKVPTPGDLRHRKAT